MEKNKLNLNDVDLKQFIDSGTFINNDNYALREDLKSKQGKDKAKAYSKLFVLNFNKLSQNVFVQSMMKGFMMVIPLLVVGGIATLIQTVPENIMHSFGKNEDFKMPTWIHRVCTEVFNYTYGICGLLSCAAITYEMTSQLNKGLIERKKIYPFVTVIAAITCFLIFTLGDNVYQLHVIPNENIVQIDDETWQIINGGSIKFNTSGGIAFGYVSLDALGPRGMLPSLLIAFSIPYVYKWCFQYNLVVRLPKFVPFAVSLTVMVLLPILFSILLFVVPAFAILELTNKGAFDWMGSKLDSLYEVSNTLGFYVIYQMFNSLCYFLGVHNAVISNLFESVRQVNVTDNAVAMHDFIQKVIGATSPTNIYVGATATNMIGGLGSIAMVPYSIFLFAKSKQLKSIFVMTALASFFNLPEPILFGLPVILNPLLFLPMLLAPIANAIMIYGFVHWGPGMYAPFVDVAWCLPWIFVLPVATGVQPISFLCMVCALVISFTVWSPFVYLQDRKILKREIKEGISVKGSIENKCGLEIIWMWLSDRKGFAEYKKNKKQLKIDNKNLQIQASKNEFNDKLIARQDKASYKTNYIRKDLQQNNILILANEPEMLDAKNLGISIIKGLEKDAETKLFLRAAIAKTLHKTKKLAKKAQLIIALESVGHIYDEYELIADNYSKIIYPVSSTQIKNLIENPTKALELVKGLTIQTTKEVNINE